MSAMRARERSGRKKRLIQAEIEVFDGSGAASGLVRIDEHGVHLHVTFGNHEPCRKCVKEALQHSFFFHANHGIVGAGHADVGDKSSASRKDVRIGGCHVSVRPKHGGNLSVQIPAHGLFFRRGLSMHVNDDDLYLRGNLGELFVGFAKGIIERSHEGAALQIEHSVANAIFGEADEQPAARQTIGEIGRPQEPRLVREKFDNLPAIPDVIAAGDHLDARREQVLHDARRNAESGRRIFAVGDAQIDLPLGQDIPKAIVDDLASGRADDISDKKDSQ